MKIRALISVLTLTGVSMSAQWSYVGQRVISQYLGYYKSIAVNPRTQEPYLQFDDNVRWGRATVVRLDGDEWKLVGQQGYNPGAVYNNGIAFTPDGVPYSVLWDGGQGGKTSVMRFKDDVWSYVSSPPAVSDSISSWQSIDVDGNGTPYIAFRENRINNYGASVLKFNGTSWEYLGGKAFTDPVQSNGGALNISLTLDKTGVPYIAYVDGTHDYVTTVQRFVNGAWEMVGTPGFAGWCSHDTRSMAFDSRNRPHIVVATKDGLAVMRFENNVWSVVGRPFSDMGGEYATIEIDAFDRIFVAYQDYRMTRRLSAAVFDGEWHDYKGITDGPVWYLTIDSDNSGNVFVGISEKVNDVWTVSVMKNSDFAVSVPKQARQRCSIHPNPSNGVFNISLDDRTYHLTVHDLQGRTVISRKVSGHASFEIRESGLYLVTLDDGKDRTVSKIVVE